MVILVFFREKPERIFVPRSGHGPGGLPASCRPSLRSRKLETACGRKRKEIPPFFAQKRKEIPPSFLTVCGRITAVPQKPSNTAHSIRAAAALCCHGAPVHLDLGPHPQKPGAAAAGVQALLRGGQQRHVVPGPPGRAGPHARHGHQAHQRPRRAGGPQEGPRGPAPPHPEPAGLGQDGFLAMRTLSRLRLVLEFSFRLLITLQLASVRKSLNDVSHFPLSMDQRERSWR